MPPDFIATVESGDADVSKTKEVEIPDSLDGMLLIIERAQNGDADAMAALRELLDRVPAIREAIGGALERTVEH